MTRQELLAAAEKCVCQDRNEQYGKPENNFARIADYWGVYLNETITAEDVAVMMIMMKIARVGSSGYSSMDSWTDVAGYAACGAEIAWMHMMAEDNAESLAYDAAEDEG